MVKNKEFSNDMSPIENTCSCSTCKNYSLAYLHHLFRAGELLGLQLITAHNIYFMNELMELIRNSINHDSLDENEEEWFS